MHKLSWANSITLQGLGGTLRESWLCPLSSGLHTKSFPCVWKVDVRYLQAQFSGSSSFLPFHTSSVPFSPSWQCVCTYNFLKNLVGLLCRSRGWTPLDKHPLQRSFLDNRFLVLASVEMAKSHILSLFQSLLYDWTLWPFVFSEV